VLLLLGCVAFLGATPGAASARPVARVISPSEEACPIEHVLLNVTYSCALEFTVRGSHGYKFTVSGQTGTRVGVVEVSADGPKGDVQYIGSGKVTADAIRARIGRLGRIAVQFEPSGRERRVKVPKKCLKERPPVVTSRLGHFVGTIEFRGERGYTSVKADGAAGGIGDPLANTPKKLQCESHESEAQSERELESVQFSGEPAKGKIALGVSHLSGNSLLPSASRSLPKDDDYLFLALGSEKVDGLTIIRSAGAFGGTKNFTFDEALTAATVTPPAPFTGTGAFVRNPDGSTSWTGSLAVRLPGLGTVSLTGGKAELATAAEQKKKFEEELTAELNKQRGSGATT
jgi:hypothetical protein